MSKSVGRLGAIKVSDDGGSTYSLVGGLQDGTANGASAAVKTTTHDDGAYETYQAGRSNWTFDAKLLLDEADAGQTKVNTNFYSKPGSYYWQFYLQSGTGFKIATGQGFVTKHTIGIPNDEASSLDITVQMAGQVTWTNQP